MSINSHGMTALVVVVAFAVPTAASGQSVLVRKHGSVVAAPLPVTALPAAATVAKANNTANVPGMVSRGLSSPGAPRGLERASSVASPRAQGLETAKLATVRVNNRLPSSTGPVHIDKPGDHDVGELAPPTATDEVSSQGAASPVARTAAPGTIQHVGQRPMNAAPRWRDRLRFSWPGSKN
jgi:hypothetical protein